ncbi:MAG: hypothetical protein HZA17_03420 [Nitrospirae bacterium]|nr:hypothetical protein [Nitrospirota bacterium]
MEDFHTGEVIYHGDFGTGRIVNVEADRITANFIKAGVKFFTREAAEEELSDTPLKNEEEEMAEDDMDTDELKEALRQVLREEGLTGTTEMAEKWDGGEIVLKPGKPGLQEKSVPIDTFFHKIVMVRNQLRVLEANINGSKNLTDSEKVDLQQYITRCYGSLTTFNVLFSDKKDYFVGSKKED